MIFDYPGKATKLKKTIYLFTSTVLGLLLSFIAHAVIEINYINQALSHSQIVVFYGSCALHPVLQASLWLIGLVFGFLIGLFWWQKVYVDRVWFNKKKAA